MQVLDQPESFNLLNTLLFNLPSSPAYSSCAQYPAVPGLVSGCGPVGFISGPVSPIITHNLASSHQNSKTQSHLLLSPLLFQFIIKKG